MIIPKNGEKKLLPLEMDQGILRMVHEWHQLKVLKNKVTKWERDARQKNNGMRATIFVFVIVPSANCF